MQTTFANGNCGTLCEKPGVQNGAIAGSKAKPLLAHAPSNGNGNERALIEMLAKSKI